MLSASLCCTAVLANSEGPLNLPKRVEQADIIVAGLVKNVEIRPSYADLQIDRTLKGDFVAPKQIKVRLKWANIERDSNGVEFVYGVKKNQYGIIILQPRDRGDYFAVPFNPSNPILPALPRTKHPKSGDPLDLVVAELKAVESAHVEESKNVEGLLRFVPKSKLQTSIAPNSKWNECTIASAPCPVRYPIHSNITKPDNVKISYGGNEVNFDVAPYAADLNRRIRRAWFPPRGQESRRVIVSFRVLLNGTMEALQVIRGSGMENVDKAALDAVSNAAPFRPLHPTATQPIDVKFTFDYNVYESKGFH